MTTPFARFCFAALALAGAGLLAVACGDDGALRVSSSQVELPTPDGPPDRSISPTPVPDNGGSASVQPSITPAPRTDLSFAPAAVLRTDDRGLWCLDYGDRIADLQLSLSREVIEGWATFTRWDVIDPSAASPAGSERLVPSWSIDGKTMLRGFGPFATSAFDQVLAAGSGDRVSMFWVPSDDATWQLVVDCYSDFHQEFRAISQVARLDAPTQASQNRLLLGLVTDAHPEASTDLEPGAEKAFLDAMPSQSAAIQPDVPGERSWLTRSNLERAFLDEDFPADEFGPLEQVVISFATAPAELVAARGNFICFRTPTALDYCFDPADEQLELQGLTTQRVNGEETIVEEWQAGSLLRTLGSLPANLRPEQSVTIATDDLGGLKVDVVD